MISHKEIIELWPSRAALARDLSEDYQLVRGWYIRNSIPSEYWCDVVRHAHERGHDNVTTDLLAAIKSLERNRSETAAA